MVEGLSDSNWKAVRAHEASLRERLAGFHGAGIRVTVEYGEGRTLVNVEETAELPLDGLGLVPAGMGMKALDHRRGLLLASQVNAWVVLGPWRGAAQSGNAPLAEALGQRGIVVQFRNPGGPSLMLPYTPGAGGQVVLGGVVYVRAGKDAREVVVHPRDASLGQPRGADGALTNTAWLYRWFGEDV